MSVRSLAKLAGTATVAALAAPAPAVAALIGPTDLSDDSAASTCLSTTCTFAAPMVPGAKAIAPFSGRITRWKVSIPDAHDALVNDGPLKLQVLKRTVDKPGISDDEFAAVRETAPEATTPDSINSFDADLQIRKGRFIGLAGTDDTEVSEGAPGGVFLNWSDALLPGDPARSPDFAFHDRYSLFNARVKR